MAGNKDYWELLRDPRWQRKRLEVMKLADFGCQECGADDQTLNVHHSFYEKDLKPWEYPAESLRCLCEDCHQKAQALYTEVKRQLGRISLKDTEILLGYAIGLELEDFPVKVAEVPSLETAIGIGHCWGLTEMEVFDLLVDGKLDGFALDK